MCWHLLLALVEHCKGSFSIIGNTTSQYGENHVLILFLFSPLHLASPFVSQHSEPQSCACRRLHWKLERADEVHITAQHSQQFTITDQTSLCHSTPEAVFNGFIFLSSSHPSHCKVSSLLPSLLSSPSWIPDGLALVIKHVFKVGLQMKVVLSLRWTLCNTLLNKTVFSS